ncbi:HlyD family secretion protein [Flagellimonas sp. CMM7]|uniref:HlyD family secretion protein n=1 Tax=Flagellimonas sp. CMM7 TaxID=2654676 RepID=UPI0013CFA216|nr:HlyD family efflux transporter periplasmic adaptor subunit [Flagellimonas sp. CMM7]UII81107.1 HlyD family secretion protein [Flagellimonas sp. CMM7]
MDDKVIFSENFLNRPPNWMMRKGNMILFLFFTLLVVFAFFLKYNEVIHAEILVTCENPPVALYSKKGGKLVYVNFKSGQEVKQDEILSVVENPSKWEDVFHLKEQLNDIDTNMVRTLDKLYQKFPSDLELEVNIHMSYQKYLRAFQSYLLHLNLDQEEHENENLSLRIGRLKRQIKIKQVQLNTSRRNYALAKQSNGRQQELLKKGVISQQQLDANEQEMLSAQNDVNRIKEEIEALYVDTLSLNDQSLKSLNRNIVNSSSNFSELQLAKQELKGKIDAWENNYALKSPISGSVTVFDVWNNHQHVPTGEHVLTVVPDKKNKLVGKCKVPIRNSAKIHKDQEVVIKLDNYPYHEWGLIKGRVVNISETPKKGDEVYYSVYVKIPNLTTTYNKEIEFKQEMMGTAKIVLQETSLLERVFYQFRGLWSDINY